MGLPWSIHKNGGWQGQWHRVERWRQLVPEAAYIDPSSDETLDYVYAFFQNFHSLRYWLCTAKVVPQQGIEAFCSSHVELKVIRHVCNATKHLSIQRAADPDVSILREYWWDSWRLQALHGAERYDLLELIDKSMHLMRDFLQPVLLSPAEYKKAANWNPTPRWLFGSESELGAKERKQEKL